MSSKKYFFFTLFLALTVTTFCLTACDSAPDSHSQAQVEVNTSNRQPTSNESAISDPANNPVKELPKSPPSHSYPSCINSDPNHICIGIKMVSYQDNAGVPVITEADTLKLVDQMNQLWSQCNIAYQLEVYRTVNPRALNLTYSPDWETESNYVREKFNDDSRFLVVAVGPWNVATIAVTMMPESGIYGTIVDKQYSHNPLTVGHELGHYQGLYHVEDTNNLMSAYIGSDTKGLTTSQCTVARNADQASWPMMMRMPN
ncbi:MAG: hypothetical protein H7333_01480 [Bdellovibrionales bacterium]|nr:hypothetical protein [Oligoflexia bacterium]